MAPLAASSLHTRPKNYYDWGLMYSTRRHRLQCTILIDVSMGLKLKTRPKWMVLPLEYDMRGEDFKDKFSYSTAQYLAIYIQVGLYRKTGYSSSVVRKFMTF